MASIQDRSTYVRRIVDLGAAGVDVRGVEATFPDQIASTDCFVCHF
jgi:hypothetical protein